MGLVIVTGGSRGLGYVCAKEMRAAGHDVVVVARDKERLVTVAAELGCQYLSLIHI